MTTEKTPSGVSPGTTPGRHALDYLTPSGRDLRVDLLRGLMVFKMITDHLPGDSPIFFPFHLRFLTDPSEGFVLISGLMTGLVYQRFIRRDGLRAGLIKLLSRAIMLYSLTVTLTLVFLVFSEKVGVPWAVGVDLSQPADFVLSVLTLRQTYFLVDVTLLYTLLFVWVPLVFVLFERGLSWLVSAASIALYVAYQLAPASLILPWPISRYDAFPLAAWQLLFFAGLWLGTRQGRFSILDARPGWRALVVTTAGFVALLAFNAWLKGNFPAMSSLEPVRAWLASLGYPRSELGPLRLLGTGVTFAFLLVLISRLWTPLHRLAGWALLPLGQHALYAYVASILVGSLVAVTVILVEPSVVWSPLGATLLKLGGIGVVLAAIRLRVLMPTSTTRRYWRAAPAVAALAVFGLLARDAAIASAAAAAAVDEVKRDHAQISQRVNADLRPGDRIWLVGLEPPGLGPAYGTAAAQAEALPDNPQTDTDVDALLSRLASGAQRIYAVYYGERESDPAGRYERWLTGHAFKASEEWVGNLRFALYATNLVPRPIAIAGAWLDGLTLASVQTDLSPVSGGQIIPLELTWKADAPPAKDLKVFVHLVAPDGKIIAQSDSPPGAGARPTTTWAAGEVVVGRRGLQIKPGTPSGPYQLYAGLYEEGSGKRLTLPSGSDRLLIGTVEVR